MSRTITALVFGSLIMSAFAGTGSAIQLVSIDVGVLVVPMKYPCPLKPKTTKWAANDWDTGIVVTSTDVRQGDRRIAEVTVPHGKVFRRTVTASQAFQRVCTFLFIPILGTDAENWLGTWRASILFNDKKVAEVGWEVVRARDGALAEYQTQLASDTKSARAHYRVGAAAALAGQDALAESELKEAAKLDATWWYPYLALGRFYQRQGNKDLALQQFHFLKGLLLGRPAEEGSFTEYIQSMLEDHLKQLEE